jgi:hypothetical protein
MQARMAARRAPFSRRNKDDRMACARLFWRDFLAENDLWEAKHDARKNVNSFAQQNFTGS